jgi:exodeoxyribonuclease VII large subunit
MNILPVGQLTEYLKLALENDPLLSDLWLSGEISNYSQYSSGHHYFTLKDEDGQLRAVMFKQSALWNTVALRNGLAVLVHGRISIYPSRGELQVVVDTVTEEGVGRLHLEFERLKAQLEEAGLFNPARKRPIPILPRVSGLVTSPHAAAFQDIKNVIARRWPIAHVVLAPTLVQGDTAPANIVAAIETLNRRSDVEVIIVARGGGSIEELWAFNDERVAMAAFASRIPIVSGVGHETDYTIIDYVADQREIRGSIMAAKLDMAQNLARLLADKRRELVNAASRLSRLTPTRVIEQQRQRVDDYSLATARALAARLALQRERVRGYSGQLAALNPHAILSRGYAIVRNTTSGHIVSSVEHAAAYDLLEVQLADGSFPAQRVDNINLAVTDEAPAYPLIVTARPGLEADPDEDLSLRPAGGQAN